MVGRIGDGMADDLPARLGRGSKGSQGGLGRSGEVRRLVLQNCAGIRNLEPVKEEEE